jgi:hypothetical protein
MYGQGVSNASNHTDVVNLGVNLDNNKIHVEIKIPKNDIGGNYEGTGWMDVAVGGVDGNYETGDGLAGSTPPTGASAYRIENNNEANFECNLQSGRSLKANDYIVMRITALGSWANQITHIEIEWSAEE